MKAEKIKNIEYLKVDRNKDQAIVLLHGYGANMQDLYGISQHIGLDYDWYFPNAPISLNFPGMYEGRAWFSIDMQELEKMMQSGEYRKFADKKSPEFDQSQIEVISFINEIKKKYSKIVIGGFSQGAMMASHIIDRIEPDGLILFSGTLIDKDSLMMKLDTSKKISFIQSHGKEDMVLEYAQAQDLYELLKLYKFDGELLPFAGGHEIPMNVLQSVDEYLKKLSC